MSKGGMWIIREEEIVPEGLTLLFGIVGKSPQTTDGEMQGLIVKDRVMCVSCDLSTIS